MYPMTTRHLLGKWVLISRVSFASKDRQSKKDELRKRNQLVLRKVLRNYRTAVSFKWPSFVPFKTELISVARVQFSILPLKYMCRRKAPPPTPGDQTKAVW